MKYLPLLTASLLAFSWCITGCGSTSTNQNASGGSGGSGGSGSGSGQSSPNEFLYANTGFSDGTVYAFHIDTSTGALTPVSGQPFKLNIQDTSPCTMGCNFTLFSNPSGRYLVYTYGQQGGSGIGTAKVDPSTGALTNVTTSDKFSGQATVDPSGKFIYGNLTGDPTTRVNAIQAFSIGNDGSLTLVPGSPFSMGGYASYAAPAVSGNFVYQVSYNEQSSATSNTSITYGFSIDPTTGALTKVGTTPDGQLGANEMVTPNGKFFYSEQDYNNSGTYDVQIVGYAINADGSLTPLTSAPQPTPDPGLAYMYMAPNGNFLYHAGPKGLRAYAINPTTGALTLTATYSTPTTEAFTIDPTSSWVYIGTPNNQIAVYKVDSTTGALTAVSADTTNLPDSAVCLVVLRIPATGS